MGYELYHSAKGSGWKKHKYISKYVKNGKTYDLYGDKLSDDDSSNKENGLDDIQKRADRLAYKGKRFIARLLNGIRTTSIKIKKYNKPTSDILRDLLNKKR